MSFAGETGTRGIAVSSVLPVLMKLKLSLDYQCPQGKSWRSVSCPELDRAQYFRATPTGQGRSKLSKSEMVESLDLP